MQWACVTLQHSSSWRPWSAQRRACKFVAVREMGVTGVQTTVYCECGNLHLSFTFILDADPGRATNPPRVSTQGMNRVTSHVVLFSHPHNSSSAMPSPVSQQDCHYTWSPCWGRGWSSNWEPPTVLTLTERTAQLGLDRQPCCIYIGNKAYKSDHLYQL